MQVKNQICTERSSTDDPEQDESQKKTSCFSNIKIFLVSECALMLAQGTVGAYLVSMSVNSTAKNSSASNSDGAADTQLHFPTILVRAHPPAAAGRPQIDDWLRLLHQADAHSASARHCFRGAACTLLLESLYAAAGEQVTKRWTQISTGVTRVPLIPEGSVGTSAPSF